MANSKKNSRRNSEPKWAFPHIDIPLLLFALFGAIALWAYVKYEKLNDTSSEEDRVEIIPSDAAK